MTEKEFNKRIINFIKNNLYIRIKTDRMDNHLDITVKLTMDDPNHDGFKWSDEITISEASVSILQ